MNSFEQRSAFRIPMPAGQNGASLRIEGRSFDAQLVDASATGVAIACPLHVTLEIGDHCELHTSTGGGPIRIVRKEVFSDGILLGAVRTGDLGNRGGLLGQLRELAIRSQRAFSACRFSAKISIIAAGVLVGGLAIGAWQLDWFTPAGSAAAAPTVESNSMPNTSAHAALNQTRDRSEPLLPVTPVVSESDQRAVRIFEQQKQLLAPETSRRLKLSPVQESEIQRALQATEAAAASPEFWDAIRRSELQILRILTPAQIKTWRQQSST